MNNKILKEILEKNNIEDWLLPTEDELIEDIAEDDTDEK